MNLRFIFTDLRASIRAWLRSPGTVFWTLLFPILLIVIFGAIFSCSDEVKYDLIVSSTPVPECGIRNIVALALLTGVGEEKVLDEILKVVQE